MNDFLVLLNFFSLFFLLFIIVSEWLTPKNRIDDSFQDKLYKLNTCYKVIKDFSFPVEKKYWGGHIETSIDYLILLDRTVVCVKYISFGGFIYGNEVAKIWWSVDDKKEKFLNPMEIIYKQFIEVEKGINLDVKVVPIVIFKDNCNLDYIESSMRDVLLLKESEFLKVFNNHRDRISKSERKKLEEQLVDLATQKNSSANE